MSITNSAKQLKNAEDIIITAMQRKYPTDFPNGISAKERLYKELTHYKDLKKRIQTLEHLYLHLLKTLVNRNMLPSVIKLNKKKSEYGKLLHNWNPKETLKSWGNRQQELVNEIFKISEGRSASPGRICETFAKGIIEGARLINKYNSIQHFWEEIRKRRVDKDFNEGLNFFKENPITGMGPALSLHFFQRLGLPVYAKPDVHVKFAMNHFGWIKRPTNNDGVLMQTIFDVYKKVGEPYVPYVIDKLLWIIGSGSLCDTEPKYEIGSLKKELKYI